MKINSVTINNFMGFSHAKFSLREKGLVLVTGDNQDDTSADSNGSGKSSLADAIMWGFYGETAREKLAADEVINETAKKDCQVVIEAEDDDGSIFTVDRWRKMASKPKRSGVALTHTKGGVTTDLTKGTDALTQPEIDQAIGCTQKVFSAATYAGQEALADLPAMSDGDLKKVVEEASGVNVLVKGYELARKRLGAAEADHDRWRLEHVHLERAVQEGMRRVGELKKRSSDYDGLKAGELSIIKGNLADTVARARSRQTERDQVDPASIQAKLDELDVKISAVNDENNRETELAAAVTDLSNKRTRQETMYLAAVAEAQKLKGELDRIKERVGTPCTSCGKSYEHQDIDDAKDIAEAKLRQKVEEAKKIAVDVTTAKAFEQAARDTLEAFRVGKTDIRSTVAERRRLAELMAQRQVAEGALLRETEAAKRLRADYERKAAETNPFVDLVANAEYEFQTTTEKYRESEVKGVELEKAVNVMKDVCKVYGPAGVRAHILDHVTPLLNERTAEYLGTLSDGNIEATWATLVPDARGDLKEKFSITVSKDKAGKSFASMSGGEKRKVRLACALALQDLVASRATKPLRLWIGDEVDTALDPAGLERLMTVLEGKARDRGTVLVISHSDLRDWIRESVTVTRKGGQSTLAGILCE